MQASFIAHHALQCGFCTPGFLMLVVNALETNPDLTDEEILDLLSSNLCRCTGYQNIIKAVRSTFAEMRQAQGRWPGQEARRAGGGAGHRRAAPGSQVETPPKN